MSGILQVQYTCHGCGLKDVPVTVAHRKQGEDIAAWVGTYVAQRVADDHPGAFAAMPRAKVRFENSTSERGRHRLREGGFCPMSMKLDSLFNDAVRETVQARKGSTSVLQQCLGIGYGRAVQLIDLMEREGIVGKADGPGPRKVLRRRA